MLKNYLVVAWRNIRKNKAYSALNIAGLAVGMAVFILIMLFVRTELGYDRYHANARNIYRVIKEDPGNYYLGSNVFAVTPGPLAPALKRDFPEVRDSTRVDGSTNVLLSVEGRFFLEKTFHWADPQTFAIFSFPIVRGDRTAALADPFSLLLSEKAARRLFGPNDPVNRTVIYHASEKNFEFKVAGIFRDIPANSHFTMDFVAPFETIVKVHGNEITHWGNSSYYTYILLKDGADPRALEAKLPAFYKKYAGDENARHREQPSRFVVQPLTAIHLRSRANFEIASVGDGRFVLLFASIAVLVLVIACVNYMNLATARSLKRAREVGLRKVVGAARGQIVGQFLGDSLALTFLALLLAVGIVLAVLPAFRGFVEREIAFNPFRDPALMPGLLLLAAIVGTAAGGYPAFFVSGLRPAATLKGSGTSRLRGKGLRNALIVFQFAASIALIICTAGVRSQLRFIRTTDMGYARDQVLVFTARGGLKKDLEPFKMELKRNPAVLDVAMSSDLPNNIGSQTVARWPGRPESVRIPIYVLDADYDFVDLYGLKIVQGRNFSRDFPSDANGAFLINESARKAIGWDDPIGRDFNRWGNDKPAGKIVGVLKDFHMHSLHLPITPLYIYLEPGTRFYSARISVKISGENIPATVALIRKTWERFAPEYPFEYSFFDDVFDRAYREERHLGAIFTVFAGLAVFIACLGLLGLASFAAEQKTREIGIRKVLGASLPGIIGGISREFMKWVVLANALAWPIGYFAMRSWLRNFAYRTSLTVSMFAGAALAAFLLAAAVIALRTYRAAAANPADSLRYE